MATTNSLSCVYAIRHVASGKVYVGSAINRTKRWTEHRRRLRNGDHHSRHLQAAWDAYGQSAFVFEVLETVAPNSIALLAVEQTHIDRLKAFDREHGYNVCIQADRSRFGVKASPETCAKIGASKVGNKNRLGAVIPNEMRERIAAKLRGGKASPETRAKLSAMRRGRPKSAAHAVAIGAANRGKKLSDAHKAALSAMYRGRRRVLTDQGLRWAERVDGGRDEAIP